MRRNELRVGRWRFALVPLIFVLGAPATARGREPRAAVEVTSDVEWEGNAASEAILSRLARTVTERLTQEGFQVVARDAEPSIVVSLSIGVPDCVLRATLQTESVARRVLGCGVVLADDQLELAQKATELVRTVYRREEVAPAERAATSLQRVPASPVLPLQPPASPVLRARAGASMMTSASSSPRVHALIRIEREPRCETTWSSIRPMLHFDR